MVTVNSHQLQELMEGYWSFLEQRKRHLENWIHTMHASKRANHQKKNFISYQERLWSSWMDISNINNCQDYFQWNLSEKLWIGSLNTRRHTEKMECMGKDVFRDEFFNCSTLRYNLRLSADLLTWTCWHQQGCCLRRHIHSMLEKKWGSKTKSPGCKIKNRSKEINNSKARIDSCTHSDKTCSACETESYRKYLQGN